MTAIRLIQKPVDGKIIFDVPEDMRDETIVIDFRPARETEPQKTLSEVSDTFFNRLKRPKPDPNFDLDSLTPYEQ